MPKTRVMAILNATPDSFSDGGRLPRGDALAAHVAALAEAGADVLDVGGESTRPGHTDVPAAEETARALPVVRAAAATGLPVSIDTQKAAVAAAAIEAGASIINDVSGGDPAMAAVAAEHGCTIIRMRRQDLGADLMASCRAALRALRDEALDAGVPRDRIILDPGLGFGDPPGGDAEANLMLVDRLAELSDGLPVLIGASRKRFIGTLTGVPEPAARVHGSVAVAVLAALRGAHVVRVHDVAATVQALRALRLSTPAR